MSLKWKLFQCGVMKLRLFSGGDDPGWPAEQDARLLVGVEILVPSVVWDLESVLGSLIYE